MTSASMRPSEADAAGGGKRPSDSSLVARPRISSDSSRYEIRTTRETTSGDVRQQRAQVAERGHVDRAQAGASGAAGIVGDVIADVQRLVGRHAEARQG